MSMTDPISDLLTRIRNAQAVGKKTVIIPCSKLKSSICDVLKSEGYIDSFETETLDNNKSNLHVTLKYYNDKPVIDKIQRVSRPGLRIYKSKDELPKILLGLGVAIISTSKGVIADRAARELGLGGEILCTVS